VGQALGPYEAEMMTGSIIKTNKYEGKIDEGLAGLGLSAISSIRLTARGPHGVRYSTKPSYPS
jgi:hypothetical protein